MLRRFLIALALTGFAPFALSQTLVLTASPTAADLRATPALTWSGVPSDATCTATGGWTGTKASSGVAVAVASITATTRYAMSCTWPAISGTTGTATVTWTPPTQNTDGTPLTDLRLYHIVYGTSSTSLAATKDVTAPASSGDITGLAAGTWYFAVVAENASGIMSAQSNIASKLVTTSAGRPAGFSSAYVDVVIRPAPNPPTNVAVTVAIAQNQSLTPVYRVLGKAGAYYPGEMYGLIPVGRECAEKVFTYRGKAFRRVTVQPSELWWTASAANLAAPCA